jgi:hypothetical protein
MRKDVAAAAQEIMDGLLKRFDKEPAPARPVPSKGPRNAAPQARPGLQTSPSKARRPVAGSSPRRPPQLSRRPSRRNT